MQLDIVMVDVQCMHGLLASIGICYLTPEQISYCGSEYYVQSKTFLHFGLKTHVLHSFVRFMCITISHHWSNLSNIDLHFPTSHRLCS